jgi:hypothetical protein
MENNMTTFFGRPAAIFFKVYDTRTGIYLGDPKQTVACDFLFDERTSHIHQIVSSRNRARRFNLIEAREMIANDLNLAYVPDPLVI